MPAHYEAFRARGLRAMPYPFRGRFQDKTYPQAYSDEEKQIILGMMGENLSQKNLFWIKRQLDPVDPYGKLCYAGQRYGRIENDGTVWRCNQYLQNNEQPLGNIFDADFPLHPEPRPCASHACGCEWWWLLDYYERRHSA
jgi:hypothetical protein